MAEIKTRATKTTPLGSFLQEGRIVEVKPISRSGRWSALLTNDLPEEPYQYNKTKRTYTLPTSLRSRHLVKVLNNTDGIKTIQFPNEVLTEQQFFEKLIDRDLNLFKRDDNFWRIDPIARVIITKSGLSLDLSDALDVIRYKILLANTDKIAPSWNRRHERSSFEFAIVDKKEMVSQELELAHVIDKADDLYFDMKNNRIKMIAFLKSTGKGVAHTVTDNWLKNEIRKIKESSAIDFMKTAQDTNLDVKVFIFDAVKAGAMYKKSGRYFLSNGMELGDLTKSVNWLNDTDNQEAKMNLKFQIENTK